MRAPSLHAVATAVGLLALHAAATAQQAAASDDKQQLEAVVVTGIRASLEKSMTAKRNANTNVEVISAEDVGKMPDKNIADAISRVSGVNVQYGGANAMDEAERVAIRGTPPSLNLVTINGHAVSAGDWHVGDQSAGNAVSSRSVGFGLLPSELIGQTVVYKNQRADLTEGGLAGSVDVLLRKPLDMRAGFSGEAALGAVYADLPGKTDPQASVLLAWKSPDKRFGVIAQAFKEDRSLRRDGQETFSYTALTNAQALSLTGGDATAAAGLVGKRLPNQFNATMFEGARKRSGGFLSLQWRPTEQLDMTLSGFSSELKAVNYNSSGFLTLNNLMAGGWRLSNAVVDGDVITAGKLTRPAGSTTNALGLEYDHFLRDGARSTSKFYDLDLKYAVSPALTLTGRVGSTEGAGYTTRQPNIVLAVVNPNVAWQMNRTRPTDWSITDASGKAIDLSNIASYQLMNANLPAITSMDKENYVHADGEWKLGDGLFSSLKFGLRSATHKRNVDVITSRWTLQDAPGATAPFTTAITGGALINQAAYPMPVPNPATALPGDYASGLDGTFPRNLLRFDQGQLAAFADKYQYWDPVAGKQWNSGYGLKETSNALYAMGEFDADALSGNVGLRAVRTQVDTTSYTQLPSNICPALAACSVNGAIVGSRFGTFVPAYTSTRHTAWLPSLNLRWDIDRQLVARASLSRSLGRPNYNELAGALTINSNTLIASMGNPLLKPITANNGDLSLAWYFAPRASLSGSVFTQRLSNYVKPVTEVATLEDPSAPGTTRQYTLTKRIGLDARLTGAEVALEMPVGNGFGFSSNATYVSSRDADGQPMLGSSKWTYNVVGYYENDRFNARLAWNWRDDYAYTVIGDGSGTTKQDLKGNYLINGLHYFKGYGALALSLGYKFTDQVSVTFDANNLNNPVRHTYMLTENAPANWYESGRQYYVNLRMKF
ncbi:TonB-dependent receptor [Roseateles sp.]|uniref:TonB-dependent receptor n=1 Tax=Roseateles sp. TaxID=1971397 RepID=UPI002DF83AAD|nr:TonB-dependent receptor [Roseateles sp.]HEV6966659.1 TonB-dependent receptor [Roseateles sp.]